MSVNLKMRWQEEKESLEDEPKPLRLGSPGRGGGAVCFLVFCWRVGRGVM